jgi:hypothetical protein
MFEKYGLYEGVINASVSSNPGMDACVGLYGIEGDSMEDWYFVVEKKELRLLWRKFTFLLKNIMLII